MTDRRFIEEAFPVKAVGAAAAKEKNIRRGNISTLHAWWARKPLAASRAAALAALTGAPDGANDWQRVSELVSQVAQWESSTNRTLLDHARRLILSSNGGRAPRMLDPFSGGGSFPLEALRLGCDVYANDYNPVAVLLLKATLEYPAKFDKLVEAEQPLGIGLLPFNNKIMVNPLLEAVRYWGNWVLERARQQLDSHFSIEPDGSTPVAHIWARTIPCPNPLCGHEIPLLRQFWLVSNGRRGAALYPSVKDGEVVFSIVGEGYDDWPDDFDADTGTVARAIATCVACRSVSGADVTRSAFQQGRAGHRLVAVVLQPANRRGKRYRVATASDFESYARSETAFNEKRTQYITSWGVDPVPDEPLTRVPLPFGVINVWVYGMDTWGSLFNHRQLLTISTFMDLIRSSEQNIADWARDHGVPEDDVSDFSRAVILYLALTLDRMASSNNTLCRWQPNGEKIADIYSRPAIGMNWGYAEPNQVNGTSRSWSELFSDTLSVIESLTSIGVSANRSEPQRSQLVCASVSQAPAQSLPFPDGFFDIVLTDPPYYDNVPYSYISDFFYVWLKRSVSHLFPDLFSTLLTPKTREVVAYTSPLGGVEDARRNFESKLLESFNEIGRVLRPEGIAVIVYAHKSTSGWENVINAILASGLVVSAAWPLNTEMQARMRAQDSATLASSIYMVSRKMERQPVAFYNDVRDELRRRLDERLQRLWDEGISGADFFIAAIGSGIEVFGRYEQVLDYEGNVVRADRLLTDVRTMATDYAVRQILHDGFGGQISSLTRFYVLWRWEYKEALVPFDEARKLAQSCGIDLAREWGRASFIRKEKEFVRVLGPQLRTLEGLEDKHELIDLLHRVLLLWEQGQRAALVNVLAGSGFAQSEAFYRVAQAISETLPNESREKKLLDGLLTGRERLREEAGRLAVQPKLPGQGS